MTTFAVVLEGLVGVAAIVGVDCVCMVGLIELNEVIELECAK